MQLYWTYHRQIVNSFLVAILKNELFPDKNPSVGADHLSSQVMLWIHNTSVQPG